MIGRRSRFEKAAARVAEALGPDDCVLVGGVAVMAHGYVRATRDVDLLTRLPLAEAKRRLEARGIVTRLLRGDFLEGGFSCLKGEVQGVVVDVLPQIVPIHWEEATLLYEGGTPLRVVGLPDLLALKIKAQGPKDLMDAAMLVLLHPAMRERARELAVAYRVGDRLDAWLADPRLVRQAREEADLERRRRRSARAKAKAKAKARPKPKPKARRGPAARPRKT